MKKTARPTSFPEEGTYRFSGMHVDLLSATPDAVIHYTVDGSAPSPASPVYRRAEGLIPISCDTAPERDVVTETVIRAIAAREGMALSEEARFVFRIEHQPSRAYRYQILRQEAGKPRLYCVKDYDNDRMYFIAGENRALLIDCGLDAQGDLDGLLRELAGGLPYDAVVLHGHPDHIAQAPKLQREGVTVYMNRRDAETAASFGVDARSFLDADDGTTFNLDGCVIRLYAVPGHTPGCLVAAEEREGWLFSSDALGNGRWEIPDTGWLQFGNPESAMDRYLSAIQSFRARTAGKLKKLFAGHTYNVLDAEQYLCALERAVQNAVDHGEAGLVPSLRPAADSYGSSRITVAGDYTTDLHWAGVNIGLLFSPGLNAENNALLSYVHIENAVCTPLFDPNITEYTVLAAESTFSLTPYVSSTRAQLSVQGMPARSKERLTFSGQQEITLCVTAPDRENTKRYTFLVR